ncbi:hypothetical protein DASB73_020780 [Starmerella bacillaris]|uniref:Uncharacterized protein n=1 Tax=Starmerella bacillaris TaxID=1247836 RepID=A0AAV5RIB5_STABA|nr:hypothetical protein DASB73_020780 [Starmerella bacillaris]
MTLAEELSATEKRVADIATELGRRQKNVNLDVQNEHALGAWNILPFSEMLIQNYVKRCVELESMLLSETRRVSGAIENDIKPASKTILTEIRSISDELSAEGHLPKLSEIVQVIWKSLA